MASRQKYIDYSQLFSQLINEEDEMNETVVSFLYHLFPNELFVRGISVLESGNMFIYVLDKDKKKSETTSNSSTDNDNISFSKMDTEVKPSEQTANTPGQHSNIERESLADALYDESHSLLYRLIIKQEGPNCPPIYVDLRHWFCSCDEFNDLFNKELLQQDEPCLYSKAVLELTNEKDYLDDKFGMLAPRAGCQRYFKHELVMCPHLLAFGLLLQTKAAVLRYFTEKKAQVFLITIQNIDEWLKLHLNIVL